MGPARSALHDSGSRPERPAGESGAHRAGELGDSRRAALIRSSFRRLTARTGRRALVTAVLAVLVVTGAALARGSHGTGQYRSTASLSAAPTIGGPLALTRVTVGQVGRSVEFAARTRGTWTPAQLSADPRRTICLLLSSSPPAPPARSVCLHAGRKRALFLAVTPLDAGGHPGRSRTASANITRSDRRSFDALVDPAAIGLGTTRYAWRVQSTWVDRGSCAANTAGLPCTQAVPATGAVASRLVSVRPIGCTRPRAEFITQAHTRRRTVALTFDDGPSIYTPQVLSVLERNHINATFFVIGEQVGSRAALVRRELRDGDVVGDHTWSHPDVAGGGPFARGQLLSTLGAIQRATGFRTCLFRAPGGAVGGALFSVASRLDLTTIQWTVDPRDWSRPGTGAIVSNVLANVRPGYIVIMHDGGGPRSETVAALPTIIRTLRRRGYTFDTIPELLGQSVIYGR